MIPGRIVFAFIDKNTNTFIPSPCTSHADNAHLKCLSKPPIYDQRYPQHYVFLWVMQTLAQMIPRPD